MEYKWIKCIDELPVYGDYSVIAYFGNNGSIEMVHIQDVFYNSYRDEKGDRFIENSNTYKNMSITHWCHLPDAPKNKGVTHESN